ncbi:MAG: phosphoribosylformylglycinamidine synthase subunit PurS [Gemmatimonadales bacterium]|nr:phosphoribosylformylglycinamidine synthase subunit PurS [Gemmatimonadales bacterium]
MPRAGLLDPEGQAVERALVELGFREAGEARVGRAIELTIEAGSAEDAGRQAQSMCERLLANPVTEDFSLEVIAA